MCIRDSVRPAGPNQLVVFLYILLPPARYSFVLPLKVPLLAWCNTLLDFSVLTLFCQGAGLFFLALIFCILAQGTAATSPRSQGGPPPRSCLTLLRLGLGLLHLLTASATLHCTPNVETVGPVLKPIFPFCSRCVGSPRTRSSCPTSMSEWTKTCRKRHVTIAKRAASMTLK